MICFLLTAVMPLCSPNSPKHTLFPGPRLVHFGWSTCLLKLSYPNDIETHKSSFASNGRLRRRLLDSPLRSTITLCSERSRLGVPATRDDGSSTQRMSTMSPGAHQRRPSRENGANSQSMSRLQNCSLVLELAQPVSFPKLAFHGWSESCLGILLCITIGRTRTGILEPVTPRWGHWLTTGTHS